MRDNPDVVDDLYRLAQKFVLLSLIFTARRRVMLCRVRWQRDIGIAVPSVVRPTVRLSETHRCCVKTAKAIVEILSPPTSLVFSSVQCCYGKSSIRPSVRLSVYQSVCDFQPSWSRRLIYFENNFIVDQLMVFTLCRPLHHGSSTTKGIILKFRVSTE